MDESFKKKIIADINKTGFPCELKIANQLKSEDWAVEQNNTYIDLELNKSREIDIVARKIYGYKSDKLHMYLAINIIIEVKKSSKRPWIIFTKPYTKAAYNKYKGPGFGQIHYQENFSTKYLSVESLMENFPRNTESEIGTSYYEAFKSPDEISKIYEALLTSIKAAFHEKRIEAFEDLEVTKESEELEEKTPKFNPLELQRLEIYMPVVVLEGILCSATLNLNKEVDLKEIDYIPMEISYSTKPYNNYFDYFPELMTNNYFNKFLNKIDIWGNSVIDLWKK